MLQLHGDILLNGESIVVWLLTPTIEITLLIPTLGIAEYFLDVLPMETNLPRDQVKMPHNDETQLELTRRV